MSAPLGFADVSKKNNQLIRKTLDASVFAAPFSAPAITTLTTGNTGGLTPLPTGYADCGHATKDGFNIAEALEISDVESLGRSEPTRSDVTKDVVTMKAVFQETKALTIGLFTGVDTSTIHPDSTTGEVSFAQPKIPANRYYRILKISVDLTDAGEIYIARFLPRAKVTDKDDQAYKDDNNANTWGVTITAYVDDTLGYSSKRFYGGPGWKALAALHGFTAGS